MSDVSPAEPRFFNVPTRHRWVASMYAAMQRAGIPVEDAILADQELRLRLAPKKGEVLSLQVRRHEEGEAAFDVVEGLGFSYRGVARLDDAQRGYLRRFRKVLAAFGPHVPPRLRGFAAIVGAELTPVQVVPALFPFVTVEQSVHEGEERMEVLLRTLSACNQACPFCAAPDHITPSEDLVLACLDVISDTLPGAAVALTGGEPTLKRSFLAELRHALSRAGIRHVQVQTNAVNFSSTLDPGAIPPDPKLDFFVSLHGADPKTYDACTGTAGQLPLALDGIRRLLAAGHRLTLNTVVNRENLDAIDRIGEEILSWTSPNRPLWHFSFLMCPEHRPAAPAMLARYSDLLPVVEKASAWARARGLEVESLLSSTHASAPACLVSEPFRRAGRTAPRLGEGETGYEDWSRSWIKARRCATCSEDPRCLGVPRHYASRFGLEELTPLGQDVLRS